ncbi:MAG: ABC transporter permease [Lachnospiraceae bacterium]|nr:ABC transporter permease [Lachnospiraceae bacterium]
MSVIKTFGKYRNLLIELIKKDIKLKYRSSYLGVVWTLLEPLLTMLVLTLVFSAMLGKGTRDFPVYILTGRLVYSFFSNGTKAALRAVRANAGMIRKVYVPKYMYPFASVLSGYVIFLISLIVLAIVALVRGVYPTLQLLWILIPLGQVLLMTTGVGMILATMAVFFRDVEYLWGVALMLIMYASAIFYQVKDVVSPTNAWIFKLNPLYAVIVNFRNAVFGQAPDFSAMWYAFGFGAVSMVLGVFVFYKKQDKFILYL